MDACYLDLRSAKRYSSIVLHSTSEKEDYGTVLFRLVARQPEHIYLTGKEMPVIKLDKIEDLFAHTECLRQFVQEIIATPPSTAPHTEPSDEIV